MATIKKTYSLDVRSAVLIDHYSKQLGISASAFVSMMATQIGEVMNTIGVAAGEELERSDAGTSGED